MRRLPIILLGLVPLLAACQSNGGGTLAQLRGERMEVKEEPIEGGLEKAMASYKQFLEVTKDSAMTPEALRRLADLKLEKEYGLARATATAGGDGGQQTAVPAATDDDENLQRADTLEAIALYKKLLAEFPYYERNDLVLYQMARGYEELGDVDAAMDAMTRLVKEYPRSAYVDEVQFRRGEFFFTRKKYLDAEDAYQAVVERGHTSDFYELALYKLGWTLYKQEMYEDGLHRFVALLDNRVATGTDVESIADDIERKRVEDTYRAISYSFSYLGGSEAIASYFDKYGRRSFESGVYANLGEHFLEKRRYNDAAASYGSFVKLNPLHKASPRFDMRVIEIYKEGDFPQLVIESNKAFAKSYGLKSDYWKNFEKGSYPEVIGYLKKNLRELANHYHARYQNPRFDHERETNFGEAQTWYREYLDSFPKEGDSPPVNRQFADLLMEHKEFVRAAREYEHTAYDYPENEQAAAAGYAAVAAWREHLKAGNKNDARSDVIRSSLRFVERFPAHEKAAPVLGSAAEEMFEAKDYAMAEATGRRVVEQYAGADQGVVRTGWLVVGHATFNQEKYADAEAAFGNVLRLTPDKDPGRGELGENLAAAIYKQGEQAAKAEEYMAAAEHYLRVGRVVPGSKVRASAEFDGAAVLVQIREWDRAAQVLQEFRKNYRNHPLQPEVTKKIALVYKESGKPALAAAEYERIETENKSEEVRRASLTIAADLYTQAGQSERALQVYKRYAAYFPRPLETMLEVRAKIAEVHKAANDKGAYEKELRQIVEADAKAGRERTDRTRYLAATSALALTEQFYDRLTEIKLVKPFDKNLKKKKAAMKAALEAFGKLTSFQVGDATAGATYYMAEIYYHFSKALMESERPDNLNSLEREQYELALEEQAFPFEEKAIAIHQKNVELISLGIYNGWVDRSIGKLASLMPARYAKAEESTGFIESMGRFEYEAVQRHSLSTQQPVEGTPVSSAAPQDSGGEG